MLSLHTAVAAPLQDCEPAEENVQQTEEGSEEVHPADVPEGLQDPGEQTEERPEEEIPPLTSPPQVPPKPMPHLQSTRDGECR